VPLEAVIRDGRVEADDWRFLDAEHAAGVLPRGPIAVPLAVWNARREELLGGHDPVGVWLSPEDDPEALKPDLPLIDLVAIHFPKAADGRGYSIGALLRARYGFRGELRAFGDIGRDHLLHLARCGFDAFTLGLGRDPAAALAAFDESSVRYQGSVDDPLPLFRRRALVHG
jgi:uncharacterized protein (DUF934 family)